MAKILFTAIVADGRGKLNGTVFSKNRAGAYMRTKVSPVNRQTAAQMGVRQRFGSLASGWRGLDESERSAWNEAAVNWPRTDVFGQLKVISGMSLYVGLNQVLVNNGISTLTLPPMPGDLGEITIDSVVMIVELTPPNFDADMTINVSDAFGGRTLQIEATAPVSAGVSFMGSRYRVIATQSGAGPSIAINFAAAYQAKFGVPAGNSKVGIRVRVVDLSTGQQGVPVTTNAIVSLVP